LLMYPDRSVSYICWPNKQEGLLAQFIYAPASFRLDDMQSVQELIKAFQVALSLSYKFLCFF